MAELLPGYLVVGSDELKSSHTIEKMKARLDASGMAAFNLDERDMAKAVSEPLVEYFANPSSTTVCLVVATTLAKNTRLYKAIAKLGAKAVISCAPMKAYELPPRVAKMAQAHGKAMGIPAAEALVSRAGENMRMLDNELKKLASMIDGPEITPAEVKPWELLNAVAARDLTRSLELLKLQPAKSEVRIWSLLVTRLRELIIAKSLDARGQAGQLASALGVQTWQVKNHASWARRWKMDELLEALSSAVDVELALKGSRDGELALQMWVMGMCRPQQRRGR